MLRKRESSGERTKLQFELDQRRVEAPFADKGHFLGDPRTLCWGKGKDPLRLDGGSSRLCLSNEGVVREGWTPNIVEKILAEQWEPEHPLHRKRQHNLPHDYFPRTVGSS